MSNDVLFLCTETTNLLILSGHLIDAKATIRTVEAPTLWSILGCARESQRYIVDFWACTQLGTSNRFQEHLHQFPVNSLQEASCVLQSLYTQLRTKEESSEEDSYESEVSVSEEESEDEVSDDAVSLEKKQN